jgi:hypothetical protein
MTQALGERRPFVAAAGVASIVLGIGAPFWPRAYGPASPVARWWRSTDRLTS